MKRIIRFHVINEDGWYTASGVDFPVVTQAPTLDELTKNIQEAAALHMQGEESFAREFAKDAPMLLDLELPALSYA